MADQIYTQSTPVQATRYSGNIGSTFWVRNVRKDLMTLDPVFTPLTQWLEFDRAIKTVMVSHPQGLYESPQSELLSTAINFEGKGTLGYSTVTATLTLTDAAVGKRFKPQQSIKIGATEETGTVATVASDFLTVTFTRDLNSSNAAQNWTDDAGAATHIYLLGTAYKEKTNPTESIWLDPFFLTSRTQIFMERIDMSRRQYGSTAHGGTYAGNWWENRTNALMKEMKMQKEKAFWENENHFVDTAGSDVRTKTQGVVWTLRNFGANIGTYAGTQPTEDEFDEWLFGFERGSVMKQIFVGMDLMKGIEKIIKDRWRIVERISRYSVLETPAALKVVNYENSNVIAEIIRCPLWEGKMRKMAVALDADMITKLQQVPDDLGSRDGRLEGIVPTNGAPIKSVQYTDDCGIIIDKPAAGGIFEQA